MAKRFTETAKWDDAWFVSLTPTQKLAWFYLCDRCDIAGVVDLAVSLAEFHLGGPFDWDEFIAVSDGRIERLPCGKLYLTRFIQWQYGELNENCNAHRAVLKVMNKHGLPNPSATLGQPFPNPTRRDQDKDKDKDKDQEEGGVGETKATRGKPNRVPAAKAAAAIPPKFSLALREAVAEWLTYKGERRENYTQTGLKGLWREVEKVAKDSGESVAIGRLRNSIANDHQGWNYPAPDERGRGSPSSRIHCGPGQVFQGSEANDGF